MTRLVAVSMTVTGQCVGSSGRATGAAKRRLPSGVIVLSPGSLFAGMVAIFSGHRV